MDEPVKTDAPESAYDLVVMGGGMGGLTSAALLAHAGKKVLVVDDHERPGGHAHAIRQDGYTFDTAVHLITNCAEKGRRMAHETPIHGLLLVGQWTRPGPGVPWVMESGVQVARRVLGLSSVEEIVPFGVAAGLGA